MLKKLLLASALIASPVAAQTIGGYTVPSDLTTQAGGGYLENAPVLETDPTKHNVNLDGTVDTTWNHGLTNIPVPSTSGRIAASTGTSSNFCLLTALGGPAGCTEAKFRTHVDFAFYAPDDPIRNARAPKTSHLHCFFGNDTTNASSVMASMRHHASGSFAAGSDVNATGYWFPCVIVKNRDGDGKNYIIKPDYIIVYYVRDAQDTAHVNDVQMAVPLVPGQRYVFGHNMDTGDTNNNGMGTYWKNLVDTTNTAIVAAGGTSRYKLGNQATYNVSRAVYNCLGATSTDPAGTSESAHYLKNPDGSDPYNGTCDYADFTGSIAGTTLTVTAITHGTIKPLMFLSGPTTNVGSTGVGGNQIKSNGTGTGGVGTYVLNSSGNSPSTNMKAYQQFWISVAGAECWDGKNLWSPGGYNHLASRIYDVLYGEMVCPKNWFSVPSVTFEFQFTQYGWADRQRWELSSDAGRRTALGGSTVNYPDGFSFHTDWMNGWDDVQMRKWEEQCLGVLHNTPHQCQTSQISSTERLVGGFIDGEAGIKHSPQINTFSMWRGTTTGPGWGLIPSAWTNSITGMQMHK